MRLTVAIALTILLISIICIILAAMLKTAEVIEKQTWFIKNSNKYYNIITKVIPITGFILMFASIVTIIYFALPVK